MKTYLVAVTLVVAGLGAGAASGPETDVGRRTSDAGIDAIFAPWNRPDSPGCAVGVFQNGAIAYAKGFGRASLEHDVPITKDSVFYAGSVSKQFTAMAAALAIQQGKLGYEDPIRKHLPELPAYADAIKVRHLLHHTSGLRDYNTLLSVAGRRDEDAWDNAAVLRITARQKALNFEPGSEYLYSNTGYTLLATIVERATGTRFATYADEQIFKPLGMTTSHFHTDARRLVRGRALAYSGSPGNWTLATPINERAGAGGLYTTIPDLLKWDENFYTGRVGGADLLKQLQTRGVLNDGKPLAYAWGLQIGTYRGLSIVEHSGSLGGYRAHIFRVPARHTSVALLCNVSSVATPATVRRIADVVLVDRFTTPVPAPAAGSGSGGGTFQTPPPATIPAGTSLADYAGTYESGEIDATFTVMVDGLTLLLQRENDAPPSVMQQASVPDQFRASGLVISFQRDANKKVTGLTVDSGRVRGLIFVRR